MKVPLKRICVTRALLVLENLCQLRRSFRAGLPPTAALAVLCASLAIFPTTVLAQQGTFVLTGGFASGNGGGPAVLLNNGIVLIVQSTTGAELYNPATGVFTLTGGSTTPAQAPTATLLNNGMVLTVGINFGKAELYDPGTGVFTATGSPNTGRHIPTATLLNSGMVLVAGGFVCPVRGCVTTAEVYDPTSGAFFPTGNSVTARDGGTATLLDNGMVLIAGGTGGIPGVGSLGLASAELYDPVAGTFTATGNMNAARSGQTATLLNNGKVLLAGGQDSNGNTLMNAELYDPATETFTVVGNMTIARSDHAATLLNNGQVLIAGGDHVQGGFAVPLATAELYDPATGTFIPTGGMNTNRVNQGATLLNNGTVLLAGGDFNSVSTAELYELVGFLPTSVSFPNQLVNVKCASQSVTLTNNQSTALTITGIAIGGINAADFAETNNCPGSVTVGASCSISVTFTPTATGSRTASVTIANTLPAGGPLSVPLSGTGVAPAPTVSLSSNGVVFVTQALGTTSVPQTVTVRNTGNATLSIQNVAIMGSNGGDFAIMSGSTCVNGSSVAVNGSCAIQLTFTPTETGNRSAVVGITDNAADSPEMISLSGSGPPIPAFSLSPSSITFQGQYVGTSGLPQSVTVTNRGNVASSVSITSVAASLADFGVLNNCTNPIAVGAKCTIGVFFDPTTGGTRIGTLTIANSAGPSPQTVALNGTGLDFSMTPGSPASATVSPGQTANYSIAIAPAGGFTQSVALSCSGGPAQSTCAVSPSMVSVSGTAAKKVMVTVTTVAGSQLPFLPFDTRRPKSMQYRMPLILALMCLLLLMAAALSLRGQDRRVRWAPVVVLAVLVCPGLTLTSCGGGSGGGGTGPQIGTFTITVTGSFTSGSANLTHSAKLTLVVQ